MKCCNGISVTFKTLGLNAHTNFLGRAVYDMVQVINNFYLGVISNFMLFGETLNTHEVPKTNYSSIRSNTRCWTTSMYLYISDGQYVILLCDKSNYLNIHITNFQSMLFLFHNTYGVLCHSPLTCLLLSDLKIIYSRMTSERILEKVPEGVTGISC